VIHCHQYTPFFYGAWAAAGTGIGQVVFTEHGRHFPDRVGWRRRGFNRFFARLARRITAVCDFTRRRLVEAEGIAASRIEVIYNGVDGRAFESAASPRDGRQRLGVERDDCMIVQVGTFRAVKNQGDAIRAFHRLKGAEPRAVLVFVGDGPQLPECRKLASDLGVENDVRFLGERGDVAEILAAADVMLCTSLCEGHSVALLEGMAAGLGIVATRVGGIPETVVDGVTGLLVPPGEPDSAAEALYTLCRQPELRRRMGQAGAERVRRHFSRDRMHERYLRIYRELAGRGGEHE
jgi:glycosyltransferase involved in cell wall biosynthesis